MTAARWEARATRLNRLDAAIRSVGDWHEPECSLGQFLRSRPSREAEDVALAAVRLTCIAAIEAANSIARDFADLPDTIELLSEPYRVPMLREQVDMFVEQVADEGLELRLPRLVRVCEARR